MHGAIDSEVSESDQAVIRPPILPRMDAVAGAEEGLRHEALEGEVPDIADAKLPGGTAGEHGERLGAQNEISRPNRRGRSARWRW
eukprot:6757355-Alexandrium_andersonii.AAC.1